MEGRPGKGPPNPRTVRDACAARCAVTGVVRLLAGNGFGLRSSDSMPSRCSLLFRCTPGRIRRTKIFQKKHVGVGVHVVHAVSDCTLQLLSVGTAKPRPTREEPPL
eukprot:2513290-Prymnesium_polylepis.1